MIRDSCLPPSLNGLNMYSKIVLKPGVICHSVEVRLLCSKVQEQRYQKDDVKFLGCRFPHENLWAYPITGVGGGGGVWSWNPSTAELFL